MSDIIVDVLLIGSGYEDDTAVVERWVGADPTVGADDDFDIIEVSSIWDYADQYGIEGLGEPYPESPPGDPLGPPDDDMVREARAFLDRYPYDVTETEEFASTPLVTQYQRGPNDSDGYDRDCRAQRDFVREMRGK